MGKLERDNYSNRYKKGVRKKKVDTFTEEQIQYIVNLREYEPNKWYKLFKNGLFIPKNKEEYEQIFWKDFKLSKRQFYEIIKKENIPHRITKRRKRTLIREYQSNNTIETYLAKMHHVYAWVKSLHKWQVDIKYLTDIPNYVKLWVFDIFLYEITFRDFKTGQTLLFFWDDRNKSSVFTAFEIFWNLMTNIWINFKDINFQFDGWAEFSNIKISWSKWDLIDMIEEKFWWYRIINKKEENGHVEAFHKRIEEDLFDTKYISDLKLKLDCWEITKYELKWEILKLINEYTLNFNKYWYTSYEPRYELFWEKSPLKIIEEDWKEEIENGKVNINFLEKYCWAYDVSKAYNMIKRKDYSYLMNAIIQLEENKFDLAKNSFKLMSDDYLNQFYNFIHSSTGQIWMKRYIEIKTFYTAYYNK